VGWSIQRRTVRPALPAIGCRLTVEWSRPGDAVGCLAAPVEIACSPQGTAWPIALLPGAPRLLSARPLLLMEFNAWALLLHHYDLLTFAEALWQACDVVAVYHGDAPSEVPGTGELFAHMNITEHHCVSDLLLRPRGAMPDVAALTEAPESRRLRVALAAMHASTSWRATAPLRRLRSLLPLR
jgi:hypothetical protein